MKIIIDVQEDELTKEEVEECIRIARANFSNVLIFKDIDWGSPTDEERQSIQALIN